MAPKGIKVRLMMGRDFDAVVRIDEKVFKTRRDNYYDLKFDKLVQSTDYIPTSLVAVNEAGEVVGFIMGELFIGEYGISQERATLDTLGVDPDYQGRGIGEFLLNEFLEHLASLDVETVNTLVGWDNQELTKFFGAHGFAPSKTINYERSLKGKGS